MVTSAKWLILIGITALHISGKLLENNALVISSKYSLVINKITANYHYDLN